MKKIKLLNSLFAITTTTLVVSPLTGCSCFNPTPSTVTLVSISITTYPKIDFNVNDTFNHDGAVVTGSYSDGITKDLTSECNFSQPDMSTAGTKDVNISHSSGKTTKYSIVVKQPGAAYYDVSFYIDGASTPAYVSTVKSGDKVVKPETPKVANKAFRGWYKASTGDDEFDFNSSITSATNIYAQFDNCDASFNNVAMSKVVKAVETFEAIATPTKADAITLCKALGVSNPTEGDDVKTTLQNNLVGIRGQIIMNGVVHKIRCIDCMHDELEGSSAGNEKYAAISFDVETLLSYTDGKGVKVQWGPSGGDNHQYSITSDLCQCLEKTPTNSFVDSEGNPITKNVFSMLKEGTPTLDGKVKSVKKQVNEYDTVTSSYVVSQYNAHLFAYTYNELDELEPSNDLEGTKYKYFEGEISKAKLDAKDKNAQWWLTSPSTQFGDGYSLRVDYSGSCNGADMITEAFNVSFGFCI